MSVAAINNVTQRPSFIDRLTHRERPAPGTAPVSGSGIADTSKVNVRDAIRNVAIGGAAGGVLGGISMLGKISLPLIGSVAGLGGIARLAGVGGAVGLGIAALPVIAPMVNKSPAAKAALLGAGIGAAAGAVLPLLPMPLGAIAGAAIGLTVHALKNRRHQAPQFTQYPGYVASPGWVSVGVVPGFANGSGTGSGSGSGAGQTGPRTPGGFPIDFDDEFSDFPPLAGAAHLSGAPIPAGDITTPPPVPVTPRPSTSTPATSAPAPSTTTPPEVGS